MAFNPCLIFCWKPINRLFGRFFVVCFDFTAGCLQEECRPLLLKLFLAAEAFHSKTLKLRAPSPTAAATTTTTKTVTAEATAEAATKLLRKEFNSFFAQHILVSERNTKLMK